MLSLTEEDAMEDTTKETPVPWGLMLIVLFFGIAMKCLLYSPRSEQDTEKKPRT